MLKIWVRGFQEGCIKDPNSYFNAYKKRDWFNDPIVKQIIFDIDKTVAVKDEYLESPVFGGMSPMMLSHGCKSLILMCKIPDSNVYASRCGDNCAEWILRLSEKQDITITLHHGMIFPKDCCMDAIMMDTGERVKTRKEFNHGYLRAAGYLPEL